MLVLLSVMASLLGMFNQTNAWFQSFLSTYGYSAVFGLITLESTGLPIPSEVILPVAGLIAFEGQQMNLYMLLAIVFIASLVGTAFDYYVAYFLQKDFVYKHLNWFHIKKESMEHFEAWFASNGSFVVFFSRLIPVIRGLASLPAGFARMDQKKFFAYSMAGAVIWDTLLVMFGYYALSVKNLTIVFVLIGVFGLALFAIYKMGIKHMKKVHAK